MLLRVNQLAKFRIVQVVKAVDFEKNSGRKTIYQLRPHLSQMRTTKYMPFTRKKAAF